jgi:hypothetical protein
MLVDGLAQRDQAGVWELPTQPTHEGHTSLDVLVEPRGSHDVDDSGVEPARALFHELPNGGLGDDRAHQAPLSCISR